MKKFAFLVHLRSSYRKDLGVLAPPLGWIPDSVYRFALRNRPLPPFIWNEVRLTPGATGPEGYIIMLPYSGRQLLEQQKLMLPRINQALALAADKGAEIVGLGALTSPVTLGGKLVEDNPHVAITNGNAYTALITHQRIRQLIRTCPSDKPMVALVGATGSVGTLVSQLLARHDGSADYLLIARNERRLNSLADDMQRISGTRPAVSQQLDDLREADIIGLLTSAADCLLQASHLKPGAVVLDDTQPRNTHPSLLRQRPDVTIIDGGLVSVPHLRFSKGHIGLSRGLSYACLAETMLLAQVGHTGNFSVGNPTYEQASHLQVLARQFAHLGFGLAPDHSFGKPLPVSAQMELA